MLNLSTALILPLTKLLLKSWLGDVAAELGTNVAKIGISRLNDHAALRSARQQAAPGRIKSQQVGLVTRTSPNNGLQCTYVGSPKR